MITVHTYMKQSRRRYFHICYFFELNSLLNLIYNTYVIAQDLRKIRPVVAFLVEHQSEVFTENLKPLLQARLQIQTTNMTNVNSLSGQNAVSSVAKPDALYNLQVPSSKIDSMNSMSVITSNSNSGNIHKIRKNLSQLAMISSNNDSSFFPNDAQHNENGIDTDYYGAGGAGSNGHSGHITGYSIEENNQVHTHVQ